METKLAIKCYFCKIHKDRDRFEQELAEYLFSNSNASIRDIATLSENRLEMDRSYVVTLVEVEQSSDDPDIQVISSYLYKYLKKNKLEAVPISRANYITLLIPVCR